MRRIKAIVRIGGYENKVSFRVDDNAELESVKSKAKMTLFSRSPGPPGPIYAESVEIVSDELE